MFVFVSVNVTSGALAQTADKASKQSTVVKLVPESGVKFRPMSSIAGACVGALYTVVGPRLVITFPVKQHHRSVPVLNTVW